MVFVAPEDLGRSVGAFFLDRSTDQPHAKAGDWMRRTADADAQKGVEAWWLSSASEWVQDDCPLDMLERVDGVLDVWFDSACVPALVGPGDTVVEGSDQHRG